MGDVEKDQDCREEQEADDFDAARGRHCGRSVMRSVLVLEVRRGRGVSASWSCKAEAAVLLVLRTPQIVTSDLDVKSCACLCDCR